MAKIKNSLQLTLTVLSKYHDYESIKLFQVRDTLIENPIRIYIYIPDTTNFHHYTSLIPFTHIYLLERTQNTIASFFQQSQMTVA